MNKKFRKNVRLVRDVFLIIGLPVIFSYLYLLHQEQIALKESTIQLLEQEKQQLAKNQIENVNQRYKAVKNFYSEEANILRDTVETQKELIKEFDSIIKNNYNDSTHIRISLEQAKEAIRNAMRVESYKDELKVMKEKESIYKDLIKSYKLETYPEN